MFCRGSSAVGQCVRALCCEQPFLNGRYEGSNPPPGSNQRRNDSEAICVVAYMIGSISGVSSVEEHQLGEQQFEVLGSARSMLKRLKDDIMSLWSGHGVGKTEPQSAIETRKHAGGGRSNRSPLTMPRLTWKQPLGETKCPYMHRWVLDFGAFALRLHRWISSDDQRAFHDHAWDFITCVLRGSYVDISERGKDFLTAGSIRFRPATHRHTVQILQPGTWTVLVTGPVVRRWGFWVNGKLMKRDRYFAVNGHHPCSSGENPVRRRPDGGLIY